VRHGDNVRHYAKRENALGYAELLASGALLTEAQVFALPLGARVALPNGATAYPDFDIAEAMTGTIVDRQPDSTWIRIDQHHTSLDDWGNLIQVWLWDDGSSVAAYDIIRLYSASLEGTDMLSEFIRQYCADNGIECDGDAFGMAFSGMDNDMTEGDVVAIVEATADTYGLRVAS
jgi:hypothetical protein